MLVFEKNVWNVESDVGRGFEEKARERERVLEKGEKYTLGLQVSQSSAFWGKADDLGVSDLLCTEIKRAARQAGITRRLAL